MFGVTIDAFDEAGPLGLGRIFSLLPSGSRQLSWHASRDFELAPSPESEDAAQGLYDSADVGGLVPPNLLTQLIEADMQVVDGELQGHYTDGTVRLILRSVHGDEWDIEASSASDLEMVRATVSSWRPYPTRHL